MPYKDPDKRKEYHQKYHKEHYQKHRDKYREDSRIWRQQNRELWNEYSRNWRRRNPDRARESRQGQYERLRTLREKIKQSLFCEICGKNHPNYLVFHHKNPLEKETEVNYLFGCSRQRLQAEIDKCEVLCMSCHRKLHIKWKKRLYHYLNESK